VSGDASFTKTVTGEPGEQPVVLVNLPKIPPPLPNAAAIAYGATPGDPLGGHVVAAMPVVLNAGAFATVPLRAATDANLVDEAGLSTTRNEVATRALVSVEDVVGVKLV